MTTNRSPAGFVSSRSHVGGCIGMFRRRLDRYGRLNIPRPWRSTFGGTVIFTSEATGLIGWSMRAFEREVQVGELGAQNHLTSRARWLAARAVVTQVRKRGRVTVPTGQPARDVVLVGFGGSFELRPLRGAAPADITRNRPIR